MTSKDGKHPAIVRLEDTECLLCFSQSPRNSYAMFMDEDWEEIIPICPRCCREMVEARKHGRELMTPAEQEVWQLMRFSPMLGKTYYDKAIDHLNKQNYTRREIRKKFLKRVHFPMDSLIDY
jgi:hypothetical protein